MDFSKLSQNQQIALGGGVVAILSLFMPWYGVSVLGASVTWSAFDAGILAWGGLLLTIAGAVVLALKALDVNDVKVGKLAAEQFALVLAAAGAALVLLRLLTGGGGVRFGLFLGVLAAAAVAYGSYRAMQDAGLEMPTADDFKSGNDS